ncbi:MAG TPA: PA0069 family radical SAM protein, partial [Nevskiaceae bacterium]|nr:PA0069 family radical SAM protein [Nevskiaceae bacterium]
MDETSQRPLRPLPPSPIKGRGAVSNPAGRFETRTSALEPDGWALDPDPPRALHTTVAAEVARRIISRNQSPDIPFEQSINPYRGCEHACVYCYARPSHAYLNLSPGLDFESRLFYKSNAVELLERELARPGYRCSPINLGANTDPYQPIERELKLTRGLLEVLLRYRHPVTIVTKGAALIARDLDLLTELARERLVMVAISLTTLDDELKRVLEPRAANAASRLKVIRALREAQVPVMALTAPIIPFINDAELEALLQAGAEAGAQAAGYVMLRLPHELKAVFREWLLAHYPLKAEHVMSLVAQMHGGKTYDAQWGQRQTGTGA